jgi:hypothetical protein
MVFDYWHAQNPLHHTVLVKAMDAAIGACDPRHFRFPPTKESLMMPEAQRLGLTAYGETYACEHLAVLAHSYVYSSRVHSRATAELIFKLLDAGRPCIVCMELDSENG